MARVAAMAAADDVFTSMEPHCEKKSNASSGDAAAGNTPAFSIMYFSALLRHDVSCSHRYVASENSTLPLPEMRDNTSMKCLNRSDISAPGMMQEPIAMAPAFTSGLWGRLFLFREMSLRPRPLGS